MEEPRRPLSCFYQQKVILSRHPDRYVHKQNEIKQLKQKNLQKKTPTPFCHYVSTRKQQLLISISSKQKVSLINYAYGIMQKQFCAGNVKWSEVVSSTKGLFWSPPFKSVSTVIKIYLNPLAVCTFYGGTPGSDFYRYCNYASSLLKSNLCPFLWSCASHLEGAATHNQKKKQDVF